MTEHTYDQASGIWREVGAWSAPEHDLQTGVPRQIVFFSGFRQSGQHWNGVQQMFLRALRQVGSSRECYVSLYPWDANVRALARQIAHMGTHRVMLVGYSWGAGRAALRLARYLESEHVTVDRMVLVDPVRFSWFLPLALVRWVRKWFPLDLPMSVRRVAVFRQETNRPMGFPVRGVHPCTVVVHEHLVQGARHETIDDMPVVHMHVAEWAREFGGSRDGGDHA